MRRTLAFVLVICGVAASSVFAQQNKTDQELTQIEKDWCLANVKKDGATLARILGDDASLISTEGKLQTKAEAVADMKSASFTTCDVDMIKVRQYGDSAVVTGRSILTAVDAKKVSSKRQVMWTDTFVRRDGRWLCVATQSSPIK